MEKYLTALVLIPDGESDFMGTVKQLKRDTHGTPVGVSHSNPVIDTSKYEVHLMMDQSNNSQII